MNNRHWIELMNGELVKRLDARTGAIFHYEREIIFPVQDAKLRRYLKEFPVMTIDTVCVLRNPDGSFNIGVSIQSPIDTFDRKCGNAKAYARAIRETSNPITGDVGEFVRNYLEVPPCCIKKPFKLIGRKGYAFDESVEFTSKICGNLKKE
jgi:hypothetical protein